MAKVNLQNLRRACFDMIAIIDEISDPETASSAANAILAELEELITIPENLSELAEKIRSSITFAGLETKDEFRAAIESVLRQHFLPVRS